MKQKLRFTDNISVRHFIEQVICNREFYFHFPLEAAHLNFERTRGGLTAAELKFSVNSDGVQYGYLRKKITQFRISELKRKEGKKRKGKRKISRAGPVFSGARRPDP